MSIFRDIDSLSTRLIVQAALDHQVEVKLLNKRKLVELSFQGQTVVFKDQVHPKTTFSAYLVCKNKEVTKALLTRAGVRTPQGVVLSNPSDASAYTTLTKPLVVKPTKGTHGDLVYVNITTEQAYNKAVSQVFSEYSSALVEEHIQGKEYRILTTRDKVIGVINRKPANVVGDGTHTLQELIDEKNKDPRRKKTHLGALVHIKIDDELLQIVSKSGLSLASVPPAGQTIYLRSNSNISTGGDSYDVSDIVHPSVKELALKAIRAIPDLYFAGLDFITSDITQEQKENYAFIEINASPMLSMHDQPYEGKKRYAAEEFIFSIFPSLR